jgi:insertion element IS1 protein InsB
LNEKEVKIAKIPERTIEKLALKNTDKVSNLFEYEVSHLALFSCEADKMWSFVGNKGNKKWIWFVMNRKNRQIIGLNVGGRTKEDAKILFENIPSAFREYSTFYTDFWESYHILDKKQHIASGKEDGRTNHIERFNNTVRQRVSRLVRNTLSFSKKEENHIGAIKYFVCHYNQNLAKKIVQ